MAESARVLAVDGGGIRGLIPSLVLAELERRSGRRAADLFDVLVGTSTGGIIALALTAPVDSQGHPLPAEQLAALYETEGPRIFHVDLFKRVRSLGGLIDERYSSEPLARALERYVGTARMSQATRPVLVTAYDTQNRKPMLLRSADPDPDVPMATAALATSAAPTYFEAVRVDLPGGAAPLSLVDGGVFSVNPAMVAYVEALREHPGAEPLVVSLGTGSLTRPFPHQKVKNWGLVEWARPLLDLVFDGESAIVQTELLHLLAPDRYYRFQTELVNGANDNLDDASPENLGALRRLAEHLIAANDQQLDTVVAALTA